VLLPWALPHKQENRLNYEATAGSASKIILTVSGVSRRCAGFALRSIQSRFYLTKHLCEAGLYCRCDRGHSLLHVSMGAVADNWERAIEDRPMLRQRNSNYLCDRDGCQRRSRLLLLSVLVLWASRVNLSNEGC
jgi:hypothetical protein